VILLKPGLRERFSITADGTETVSGRETWKLAFEELARPTLVRNVTGMNLVMRGTPEMTEHYRASTGSEEIRCTATYCNYRRFSVSADELIEKPPAPKKPGDGLD
jgi:hypothetical protein